MDRTWAIVGVGGSPGVPSSGIPGEEDQVGPCEQLDALSPFNPSSKMWQKEKPCHGPTPSSPPRRNYEIAPGMPLASRGHRPTIYPDSTSGMHKLPALVRQEGSEKGNHSFFRGGKRESSLCS
eukprot:TRINITY_DN2_c0_g1_i1.p4 TRINITY_DN2_c0_g1~~TRINITY_DN2_c0_g1_i1.p4  ORF type:complete len:123 (+),score=4.50 TRINITY_DN2_c0_g1_i1:3172-3540(+)